MATLTEFQANTKPGIVYEIHCTTIILLSLVEDDKILHASFKVNKYDRDYQVWKREPLSIELPNKKTLIQKLEYIHYNLPAGRQVLYVRGYV